MLAGELRPTAALYAPPVSQWGSTYVLKVTYSDDTGVNAATLGDNDVQIIGPNGFSHRFEPVLELVLLGAVEELPLDLERGDTPAVGEIERPRE